MYCQFSFYSNLKNKIWQIWIASGNLLICKELLQGLVIIIVYIIINFNWISHLKVIGSVESNQSPD